MAALVSGSSSGAGTQGRDAAGAVCGTTAGEDTGCGVGSSGDDTASTPEQDTKRPANVNFGSVNAANADTNG